jgi:serine protease Do
LRRIIQLGLLAATLLAAAALVFAACGADDGDSRAGSTASPEARATDSASGLQTVSTDNGDTFTAVDLVKVLRPSVVHIQADGAVGTGFIVDTDGHIVTNNHVITGGTSAVARTITVTLSDGSEETAEVVGRDPPTDIAVLKVNAEDLDPIDLGSSSDLEVGEDVLAMGNALNLPGGPTVTTGVVSALNRVIEESDVGISIPDAIQTDASINPGNSGGPLVNMHGQVVGITTAVIRGNAEGIGLAISIDSAKPIIDELIANGEVDRGVLGIRYAQQGDAFGYFQCGLDTFEGVLIYQVQSNTGAEEAGLQPCDIITGIGDTGITNTGDLFRALTEHRAGETVQVTYERDGREDTVEVTLG